MELEKVLHMNGGDGDNSYANNSSQQKEAILKAKPLLQETMTEFYCNNFPDCIRFTDMGCSTGPNALLPTWEILDALHKTCHSLNRKPPVLHVFLNDLPGNDFNTIFKSLPGFYERLKNGENQNEFLSCFIAAVAGSFYGRLFPPRFLHFVFSSYSLHWLSKVPEGLVSEMSIPVNIWNIFPTRTSPPGVHKAYLDQFEKDFTTFLKLRSQELITGGRMILTLGGSQSKDESLKNYRPILLELIGQTLHEMVLEGVVEESKLDAFNMPIYAPSLEEIRYVIQREESYYINLLETFELSWDAGSNNGENSLEGKYTRGKQVAMKSRPVLEPILVSHCGNDILDDLFQRLSIRVADCMEKGLGVYTNVIISLTKK
ncbi:probable caffeine synthase 3 [Pistacia vera]|uniref:probable caffeine synthase 3 n=1 Tax=Pistacia vera TaxID=55513 RepID=UPI001263B82D|nr:probable caffeine synthase 3 [Pistacia vera]